METLGPDYIFSRFPEIHKLVLVLLVVIFTDHCVIVTVIPHDTIMFGNTFRTL